MKIIIACAISIFFVSSCSQRNVNPVAYLVTEKDLIPEGITFSSTTNAFYLSSIHKTKIIEIDAKTGKFKDFIPSGSSNLSFLGLLADDTNKQLWACGNSDENGKTRSWVLKFDLITGTLIKTYSFRDTVGDLYNDLAEDKAGNIYFTGTEGQSVYTINKKTDSVTVFYDRVEILHPNGITISPDNKYLFVASTDYGIRVLDIEKKEIIGNPDTLINSTGIDGLKYYKNSLIGIQNEVKTKSDVKIVQYFLDKTGTKIIEMKIIDQNNPDFDIPTTCVIVKRNLYCLANSQLWNMKPSGNEILHPELLKDIRILKYNLN